MKRKGVAFLILILALVLLFVGSICVGSVGMRVADLWDALCQKGSGTYSRIIWDIRLPRFFAALFLGGALAVSGYLLQTFFGNPIAGPFVLGISSGAKFTVALAMIFLLERGIHLSSTGMILAAALGALLAMGFVLLVSLRVHKMSILIVCGIMIGYITSAVTDILVTFANDSNIVNLHNWSQGSFSGTAWPQVRLMAVVVAVLFVASFVLAKGINAFRLGEGYAKSMGVNTKALRIWLIILSSLLAAVVTAFAGPISFVGIAVPHLMKRLTGSGDARLLIPACFLGGATVTCLCDLLARSIFSPTELNISTVTAVLLVPVVLAMMLRKRGEVQS